MFKESFKYYKRKNPEPNLSNVLRVSVDNSQVEVFSHLKYYNGNNSSVYLIPTNKWQIFSIKNKPGLIFIKNPFTAHGQRYWIQRCLKDFSKKPYKLNIDAHNYLNKGENWWDVCTIDKNRKEELATKLRWATLGYHHNWDTKIYSETSKSEFPLDLAELCDTIAKELRFNDFKAEAAIVNYYFMNSTLSGHTDHSENDLEAPLFSFSFGQSAIFLIGGLTEDEPALPILIESGDVLIMSKESRLCYHAVPKIIPADYQTWNSEFDCILNENNLFPLKCIDEANWRAFNQFIQNCRLNMNVRQVLKPGQCFLSDN